MLEVHPGADLAPHLPPPNHPLYLALLGELIRIDIERGWANGKRKCVTDYAPRFPAVLTNPALLTAIVFEEYRQRVRVGENVSPDEYRLRYGIETHGWVDFPSDSPGPPSLAPGDEDGPPTQVLDGAQKRRTDPTGTNIVPAPSPTQNRLAQQDRAARRAALSNAEAVSYLREAAESLPEVGTAFVGFHLVDELGR